MAKKSNSGKFGKLPKQYRFALNPYPELRFTSCPKCRKKTGQRKLPLVIHVHPANLIALNYTNRYCSRCDLLISHKHEIEHLLTEMFVRKAPEIVGNNYLIIGTAEKKAWQAGLRQPLSVDEIRQFVRDFKRYEELQMSSAGWFLEGQEPPVMIPPPSDEWIKL